MPSLEVLAPHQRAALDLVLRRGRSYGAIADLLDMPAAQVRGRAHAALTALVAPTGVPHDEIGRVADLVLGQQTSGEREQTHALLAASEAARAWRDALEDALAPVLAGARRNGQGTARGDSEGAAPDASEGAAPDASEGAAPDASEGFDPGAIESASGGAALGEGAGRDGRAPARASRGRRAALAGGVVAIVAVALGWLLLSAPDDAADEPRSAASVTATATATPAALRPAGEVTLRSAPGAGARGVMALFEAADDRLAFTITAQGLPPSGEEQDAYSVWLLGGTAPPRRLGFTGRVGEDGRLVAGGPQARDADRFPRLLAGADEVIVARARSQRAARPGRIFLRGPLPPLR